MLIKSRSITATYFPVEWGITVKGGKIIALARFVRNEVGDYAFYGDDADCYREFEEEGFTLSKQAGSYEEANDWLRKTVFEGE